MVAPPRTPLRVDRLRALNLPLRVQVELDALGRPIAIRRRQDGSPPPHPPSPRQNGRTAERDGAAIEAVGETWRVDDEWWRKPISRQYVEVMLAGGGHVVLYRDLVTGEWFEQRL